MPRLHKYAMTSNCALYDDAIRDILEGINVLSDEESPCSSQIQDLAHSLKCLEKARTIEAARMADIEKWGKTPSKTIEKFLALETAFVHYCRYKALYHDSHSDADKAHMVKYMEDTLTAHKHLSDHVRMDCTGCEEERAVIQRWMAEHHPA
jgi:hypothetical protein